MHCSSAARTAYASACLVSEDEPIEPGLKLFRPHLEERRLGADAGRSGSPHLAVEGAVGTEEAFADIGIEDGLVVGELGDRGGGRLRNLPPFLSVELAARKRGEQQNLGLRLARTDLRDDGGVARDEIGQRVPGIGLSPAAGLCSTTSFA